MVTKSPLTQAIHNADYAYGRFDAHRDRAIARRQVIQLHSAGYQPSEIAVMVGVSAATVRRIVKGDIDTTHQPAPLTQPHWTDEDCAVLELTVNAALRLAARLRDDDPRIVWDALTNLGRDELQQLAVVLLAAVPIHQTKQQIFDWVYKIGATS